MSSRQTPEFCPTRRDEARRLLAVTGGLAAALEVMRGQFNTLQTRAQLLLTVSTLALTITGFSGPRIAAAGAFQRNSMALGLVIVLASMVLIIGGSLRVHWVTQFTGPDDETLVAGVLRYRDAKTRLFFVELCLLVAGLACYVASVVSYFLVGAP